MVLEAIRYEPGRLTILDQLALPHAETWEPVFTAESAWEAIRSMKVRGAPAIAIVAALSVTVEQHAAVKATSTLHDETEAKPVRDEIVGRLEYLLTSRPTAVNLGDAVRKLTAVVDEAVAQSVNGREVRLAFIAAAERMLADDVSDNKAIGDNGAKWILEYASSKSDAAVIGQGKVSVMTHCNTGSLATAGYGTALGIVRSLHATGRLAHTFYGETRPYNQGSRLTGYELLHDKIPATLVTDSMAGALMAQRGPKRSSHVGKLAAEAESQAQERQEDAPLVAVVVGADRVAANGDTANKIGTYALAILARYHGVAFVVAAPRTTIDLHTPDGSEIVIEQRKQREVTVVKGPSVSSDAVVDLQDVREVSIAPTATNAWNPAFDVTPAELIDAIVTEVGVSVKDAEGKFQLAQLFEKVNGVQK